MDSNPLCYMTGEEVQVGDRVCFNGSYGTVVFVSDGEVEQISPGYEDYTGSSRGVIVCDDDGAISNVIDPDSRLAFMDRG